MTTLNFEQVQNLPFLYIYGFTVARASNTTLTVSNGQCRDSTNVFDISVTTTSTTIDATVVGANGIDVGSLQASKIYYVHVIYDNTLAHNPAFLISLSATAPILPFGYSAFRKIGIWTTDGSSHFILGYVCGNSNTRVFHYASPIQVLTNGTAISNTNIDLSAFVPPIDNTAVYFSGVINSTTAGNATSIKNGTTTVITWTAPVISTDIYHTFKMLSQLSSGVPVITYQNGANVTTNIFLESFDYYL